MEKPLFILGCTKSGTTLMRSLFDGHPEFFVIPMESHFFQNIRYWVSYYQRRVKPEELSFNEMKRNLYSWVNHMNTYYDRIADNFTKGMWNMDDFKKIIDSEKVNDLRDLSDLYTKAIHFALHGSHLDETKEFVEKSVENAEFAVEWKKLYPNARFIHILRNPYSNIVSFRKYLTKKSFPFLKGVIFSMYNSYYFLFKNLKLIDNYKVILYEDLISDPENTMKELSEFLGIEYQPSLLYPTLLGNSWAGNSTASVQYTKVSPINIDKWKKDITNFEINIVNELFDQVLDKFNFEKLTAKRSKFFPAKNENLKNYVLNRALWRTMPKF